MKPSLRIMTEYKPHITAEFLTLLPARHFKHHSWRQGSEQLHVVRWQSRARNGCDDKNSWLPQKNTSHNGWSKEKIFL